MKILQSSLIGKPGATFGLWHADPPLVILLLVSSAIAVLLAISTGFLLGTDRAQECIFYPV